MTILAEIETFLVESGMTAFRFGKRCMGDTGLVTRLRDGRVPFACTEQRIRAFIAEERRNPSPSVKRCARATACACGAPVSRKAKRCRSCAVAARVGTPTAKTRSIPADFLKVAPGRTINELQRHYHAGPATIIRWREEAAIPVPPSNLRPVPDGFALVARGMTMKQLRERFGASEPLVRRWCAETGAEPRRAGYVRFRQAQPRPLPDARDQSRAGLAAQFLQRFGSVVRCNADGAADPKGSHWLRGGRFVLTDDEIMARATRNGWRPDAWREVVEA